MNHKKAKKVVSCEKEGQVRKEGKFPCAVYRKGACNSSVMCQFFKCWMHEIVVVVVDVKGQ